MHYELSQFLYSPQAINLVLRIMCVQYFKPRQIFTKKKQSCAYIGIYIFFKRLIGELLQNVYLLELLQLSFFPCM